MNPRLIILTLGAAMSLGVGCASPAPVGGSGEELIGGTVEAGHVSVGALTVDLGASGVRLCSGTKIADGWVLSAGACVYDVTAADVDFIVGQDILDVTAELHSVTQIHLHPSFVPPGMGAAESDIALLEVPGLTALPNAIPNSVDIYDRSGSPVTWVGYGYTSLSPDTGEGVRRSATGTITAVDFGHIYYSFAGALPCGPDVGGPTFLDFAGEVRMIGVINSMDENCQVMSVDTRVDQVYPWIASTLDMGLTDGGVPDAGPPGDAGPLPPDGGLATPSLPGPCDCHASPGLPGPLPSAAGSLLLLVLAGWRLRRRSAATSR